MKPDIKSQIAATNCEQIRAMFDTSPYPAYDYQCAAFRLTSDEIRRKGDVHPFIIGASVSAGKTDMISMVCHRIQQMNRVQEQNGREPFQALVISRQGEIIEQDSQQLWKYGVQNSIYCAGLSRKAVAYPIIVGSEGTVSNALVRTGDKRVDLESFTPFFVLIDECHMLSVDDYCESELAKEDYATMVKNGRSQYTIIIRELERRCMEKYGKRLRIIGYTGSPWRDNQHIVNENMKTPGFWRKMVIDIDTSYLCSVGAVVPYRFGDTGGMRYDLGDFHTDGEDGLRDFSAKEMREMEKEILSQGTLTQKIMMDVQRISADRNCVLVTCSGKKHCQEAANALLPGTSYVIVTDDMGQKKRMEVMKDVKAGKYKYTFQIGCLTTGVNVPMWDVGVILRRIGSITLLTQLNGRIIRLLRHEEYPNAKPKEDALILDYSGTMDDLGGSFLSPELEQYQYQNAEAKDEWQTCPICDGNNSVYARRCIHTDLAGSRCEYFFKFRLCEDLHAPSGKLIKDGCGVKNDPCARYCRGCGGTLIDPNDKLSGTHYTENDYYDVLGFKVKLTKNQSSLIFEYALNDGDGGIFFAREHLMPESPQKWARNAYISNISKHVTMPQQKKEMISIKNAIKLMSYVDYIKAPTKITYRKSGQGKDVISNKVFA